MSLINQMLNDLERRGGPLPVHAGPAMPAAGVDFDQVPAHWRRYSLAAALLTLTAAGGGYLLAGLASAPLLQTLSASPIPDAVAPAQPPATQYAAAIAQAPAEIAALVDAPALAAPVASDAPTTVLQIDDAVLDELAVAIAAPETGMPAPADTAGEVVEVGRPSMIIAAATPPVIDPVAHGLQQGRALLADGRYAEAATALREVLVIAPVQVEARLMLAQSLLMQQQSADARSVIEDGLKLASGPARAQLANYLARLLVDDGETMRALSVLYDAAADSESDPEYLALAAALEQRLARHDDAIRSYRTLIGRHGPRGVWWLGLGISLAATAQNAQAIDAFNAAMRDPALDFRVRQYVTGEIARLRTGT